MGQAPLLSIRGIKKSFSGVQALLDGSLDLHRGDIHALCGGNGAGKSTLLNILMGFIKPDQGEIFIDGKEVRFTNAREALHAGIAIVQQELSGVPHLTVAENILLGAEPSRYGFVDFRQLNEQAERLLQSLGFDLDPTATMDTLGIASQQLVEIAKALSHRNADILIFDEPSSALGEEDAGRLFEAMRDLASSGKSIIFVTHRIAEIFAIASTYTVLKDGARVQSGKISDITPERLIEVMIGGDVEGEFIKDNTPGSAPLLEVHGLTRAPRFADVSFTLHEGEVLGIYGLVGSGRTEVLDTIYGLCRGDSGTVSVRERPLKGGSPSEALDAGVAYLTEDRKRSGLVPRASVGDNLSLSVLWRIQRWGFIRFPEERSRVDKAVGMMRIKTPTTSEQVQNLSGGNQQKVVLGRCVLTEPKVLLLDEPTRGVDVGTKRELYRFISSFARAGGAVVIVSSEMEEVMGVSDRVLVLRKGRLASVLSREEATRKQIMMAAV
jgi:putative xylitol transport system ATP-binding protein